MRAATQHRAHCSTDRSVDWRPSGGGAERGYAPIADAHTVARAAPALVVPIDRAIVLHAPVLGSVASQHPNPDCINRTNRR